MSYDSEKPPPRYEIADEFLAVVPDKAAKHDRVFGGTPLEMGTAPREEPVYGSPMFGDYANLDPVDRAVITGQVSPAALDALDAAYEDDDGERWEYVSREEAAMALVDDFPELANDDDARQLVEAAQREAAALGSPELVEDPTFLRMVQMIRTGHAVSPARHAQRQAAERADRQAYVNDVLGDLIVTGGKVPGPPPPEPLPKTGSRVLPF